MGAVFNPVQAKTTVGVDFKENRYWLMVRENRLTQLKQSLLQNNVSCDQVVNEMSGHTIVHEAVVLNRKDIFKLCLVYGADWNKGDGYGATALMKASGLGRTWYVQELLKQGADPSRKDVDGQTALDYAGLMEQYEVIELMEELASQS